MASDGLYVVVSFGAGAVAAGVGHVLTLMRDRRRDIQDEIEADRRATREYLERRLTHVEQCVEELRESAAGTDALLRAYVRGHKEL